MKTKKLLVLVVMFLFLFTAVVVMPTVFPSSVYAEDTTGEGTGETISEEFKQILNEEGKLVVTDTSMYEDTRVFVNNYLSKYASEAYTSYFFINAYDETTSKCKIARMKNNILVEEHTVDVIFQEKVSVDFNKILTNGKFLVPSSTQSYLNDILGNYLNGISLSDEKYIYSIAIGSTGNMLINDEATKATIQMKNKKQNVLEQHIVDLTYLTEKSETFKKELNKDGKLVFNSVEPTNNDDMYFLFETLVMKTPENEGGYMMGETSDDFTSMVFTINLGKANQETHKVDIVYNYDKAIKEKLAGFVKNFPKASGNEESKYFYVRDLELINYWVNNVQNNDNEHLDAFSGEFREIVNGSNIEYYVDNRAGMDEVFCMERMGVAIFKYQGIIYHIDSALGTIADQIIYVPDATGSTAEEFMSAAQKRINEYLKNDNTVKLSYAGTVEDVIYKGMYESTRSEWEGQFPNWTIEEWKTAFVPAYNDFGEEIVYIKGVEENDFAFNATVKVGNKEKVFRVIVKKDSSKMVTPTYKTSDMTTNVEISSTSSAIPLDTNIQSNQLTSGDEYEKIIKLLNVEENAMYDLKLYSSSINDYVTKLDDGTFEVKIPVPDNLKGKTLVAYYTTGTGEPEKYAVEVKDGYAIFKTNHFSIYTLAENKVVPSGEENDPNKGNTGNDGNTGNESGDTNNGSENNNKEGGNAENNNENANNGSTNNDTKTPKTGDSVVFFVATMLVAIVGIATIIKFRK